MIITVAKISAKRQGPSEDKLHVGAGQILRLFGPSVTLSLNAQFLKSLEQRRHLCGQGQLLTCREHQPPCTSSAFQRQPIPVCVQVPRRAEPRKYILHEIWSRTGTSVPRGSCRTRPPTRRGWASSWVIQIRPPPNDISTRSAASAESWSSADVGSSRSRKAGFSAMQIANVTRCA